LEYLHETHHPLPNPHFGVLLPELPISAANAEMDDQETVLMNNAKAFVDSFEKGDAKAVTGWEEAYKWSRDRRFLHL
jgi:hypothetical protein